MNWVFDLDGTWVDSFALYFSALDEIFATHGAHRAARFTPELRLPALTESLDAFFIQHLGPERLEPAFELLQRRSQDDARRIRAFTGMEACVEKLLASGSRVAVWTNRDLVSARLILQHSGLERLVETCVSGTCVERRKPDPEGLLRIIRGFGCAPSEVTMVGDHEHDVSAAKAIGARAVRASWHSYWDEADCRIADHQFRTVEEFGRWAVG